MYRSRNIVRVIKSRRFRWAVQVVRKKAGRSSLKTSTGSPIGKRPLGKSRGKWEDSIRMDLKEIGVNTRNRVD